jgi:hypothetical protein
LARKPDVAAIAALLRAVEDRNVSLQRSAVRALIAVAESSGVAALAGNIAQLAPGSRRRVLARIGHQAPHAIDELLLAMSAHPEPRILGEQPAAVAPAPLPDEETDTLRRFRNWLLERPAASSRSASSR